MNKKQIILLGSRAILLGLGLILCVYGLYKGYKFDTLVGMIFLNSWRIGRLEQKIRDFEDSIKEG